MTILSLHDHHADIVCPSEVRIPNSGSPELNVQSLMSHHGCPMDNFGPFALALNQTVSHEITSGELTTSELVMTRTT